MRPQRLPCRAPALVYMCQGVFNYSMYTRLRIAFLVSSPPCHRATNLYQVTNRPSRTRASSDTYRRQASHTHGTIGKTWSKYNASSVTGWA